MVKLPMKINGGSDFEDAGTSRYLLLVGGWTEPHLKKYARQNGNLSQIGVKIKNAQFGVALLQIFLDEGSSHLWVDRQDF